MSTNICILCARRAGDRQQHHEAVPVGEQKRRLDAGAGVLPRATSGEAQSNIATRASFLHVSPLLDVFTRSPLTQIFSFAPCPLGQAPLLALFKATAERVLSISNHPGAAGNPDAYRQLVL